MGSVNSNNSGDLYTTSGSLPSGGGAHTVSGWFKIVNYTGNSGRSLVDFSYFFDAAALRICQGNGTNGGAANTLVALWQQNSANDKFPQTILTGSDSSWVFIGITHANAATSFNVYWRLEGAPALSSGSVSATDAPLVGTYQVNKIFDDETSAPHTNASARSYKLWNRELTSSELLAESASLNSVINSTSLFAFLDLDSITNAGTDLGPGGNNYTVENTLANDATEPNAALFTPSTIAYITA